MAGSAEMTFSGVFSWGVYYGYGLAFVFGIYITKASKSSELVFCRNLNDDDVML